MNIDELIVTQSGIRDTEQLFRMTEFVKSGGIFSPEALAKNYKGHDVPKKIAISIFPDGKKYIHDGHTRVLSIFLAGRDLREEEYFIKNWTYDEYLQTDRKKGWVTPFDPRIETRLADFITFKNEALTLSDEDLSKFIIKNKHKFCEKREYHHISDLNLYLV